MRERPVLFSGPMVRAILAGSKSQTRRLIRGPYTIDELDDGTPWPLYPGYVAGGDVEGEPVPCPHGEPGDRLWVRETWYDDYERVPGEAYELNVDRLDDGRVEGIEYRASHDCTNWDAGCPCNPDGDGKRSGWRPSIFMPRWASRITLEVTSVRVKRLQDISEADAMAEGLCGPLIDPELDALVNQIGRAPRDAFAELWDSINGKRAPWASNPLVWVVEFRRVQL